MGYTPPTIEDKGGISVHLDATKEKHNGYGSKDLKKLWNWGADKHMNISGLAIMFGVSWPTMDGWLDLLHKEANIPRVDKSIANSNNMHDNAK